MLSSKQQPYDIHYYRNSRTLRVSVREYIEALSERDRAKVFAYLRFLGEHGGRLDEPYSRYVGRGIRELRVELARKRHRIFYIAVEEKRILLLHAFLKRTPKMPPQEFRRALNNLADYRANKISIQHEN